MRVYILILLLVLGGLLNKPALAQQNLKLKDIAKFEFTIRGGGLSNYFKSIEVIPEGSNWKCYQTRLVGFGNINDQSRKFKADIPESLLLSLISIINKPDTAIDIKLFNIKNDVLITYLDSLQIRLSPAEKARVAEAINSKDTINKALYRIYHPFFRMGDDRTHSEIKITTKNNVVITTYATSFGYLDFEPWHIMNTLSYNPTFADIFETIAGEDRYVKSRRKRSVVEIDKAIYYELFNVPINYLFLQKTMRIKSDDQE